MTLEQVLFEQLGVSQQDIDKAREYQRKNGGRLEKLLVNLGCLTEEALVDVYSAYLSLKKLDSIAGYEVDKTLLKSSSLKDVLHEHAWVIVTGENQQPLVISADPLSIEAVTALQQHNLDQLPIVVANKTDVDKLWSTFMPAEGKMDMDGLSDIEEDKLRELASEAPVVNLLNTLITRALKMGASDMHIEPFDDRAKVRFRIDGVLKDIENVPASMQLPLVSRVKILSSMDIAEKRRPQDGKIEARIANKELDIRVSCLPLGSGESVVMRFLLKESVQYEMAVLGLNSDIEEKIRQDLQKTSGVILLTGPTGSGKTTSLYTFLHELNDEDSKIITLEDPIEYQLDGVNQVQINNEIGFSFANGLRSIVRQDPDIIMVGEIRDQETARTALQSALTGHLVFSTVHTNDAPSAYTRLLDLGVEDFLLDAALVSIMAQRLVRKVCPHCAEPDDNTHFAVEPAVLQQLSQRYCGGKMQFKRAVGCEHCDGTGYKGRVAIMEYLRCDNTIKSLPKDGNFIAKAKEWNAKCGNRTLLDDGLVKAMLGITTFDEVIRVAG